MSAAEVGVALVLTAVVIIVCTLAAVVPGIRGRDDREGGIILAGLLAVVGIWMAVAFR